MSAAGIAARGFVPQPPLALRVGVTGSRTLSPDAVPTLRVAVAAVLASVRAALDRAAADPLVGAAYGLNDTPPPAPLLRLISPLADGADRLVAEEALRLDYRLEAALPFALAEYEQDFDPPSREQFRALLAQAEPEQADAPARILALDGAHGPHRDASYEAVGRLVVRNCDLLIAIWNGEPAAGRGGTGEIVRLAALSGPPVWWIHANGAGEPRLINDIGDYREPDSAARGAAAEAALHHYLSAVIFPWRTLPIGLAEYVREQKLRDHWLWRAHKAVMAVLSWRPRRERAGEADMTAPPSPLAAFWQRFRDPADTLSVAYRDRYRSSYVLVFGLAGVALTCAVLALTEESWRAPATSIEFAALLAIAVLVWRNLRGRWHTRWMDYRLLAELCRKQEALALFGWCLPIAQVTRVLGEAPLKHMGAEPPDGAPHGAWVRWYFDALVRTAPLPTGALAGQQLEDARQRVRATLIAGQAAYHRARCEDNERAGKVLAVIASGSFALTVVLVAVKLLLLRALPEAAHKLGMVTAILPAISAASVGFRAYAELETIAHESERMERVMTDAAARIRALRLDQPLASQDLAAEVLLLANEMLRDVEGWEHLFRVKVIEAP